jgi:signal transduction histidine kinase
MPIQVVHLEDNPLDAELVHEALARDGIDCAITHVSDRHAFLSALMKRPDIVLADYSLPDFDGAAAQVIVNERWPDVPFVLVSGSVGEERAIEALRGGATDYVLKHRLRPLSGVVRRALAESEERLRRRRAEEDLRQLNAVLEERVRDARLEADRANRAKSEFLARMSHELRTPLNAILGFAQLFRVESLSPEDAENVHQILHGGRHLLDLINEVLDISRIEAGHLAISTERVELTPMMVEALEFIRPLADVRQVTLHPPEVQDAPLYALADRQRLRQVMLNLCSNAVKYNRSGGDVFVSCARDGRGAVRIGVRDTGFGIPPAKLSRLFTPFERLGAERTSIEGTGLGLALCQRLTEAMFGELRVDSRVDEGTTFYLTLPEATAPTVEPSPSPPVEVHVRHEQANDGSVLYVEDTAANVRLMQRLLARRPGVQLLHAADGKLGVAMFQAHRPPLIMLDLHLPDIPGEDVLAQVRATPGRQPVVVILSADASVAQQARLLAAGADGYLPKPLLVDDVLQLLDRVLAGPRRQVDVL